jgi:hypothetical protein
MVSGGELGEGYSDREGSRGGEGIRGIKMDFSHICIFCDFSGS